jgi:hypothetical protein
MNTNGNQGAQRWNLFPPKGSTPRWLTLPVLYVIATNALQSLLAHSPDRLVQVLEALSQILQIADGSPIHPCSCSQPDNRQVLTTKLCNHVGALSKAPKEWIPNDCPPAKMGMDVLDNHHLLGQPLYKHTLTLPPYDNFNQPTSKCVSTNTASPSCPSAKETVTPHHSGLMSRSAVTLSKMSS